MNRRIPSFILGLLVAAFASRSAEAMNSGFAFLEIPTGARASALGGAYTSLAQGVDAAFWNPAALDAVRGVQVLGGHYELYQSLHHDHFAIARKTFGGGLGASVRALYSGPIDERDEVGNLIGSFGVNDLEFGLAYGHPVAPGVAVGGSARLVRERIADAATSTYSFGLGATWEPSSVTGLRLSAIGENIGRDAQYFIDGQRGGSVPLPMASQTGVSYVFGIGDRTQLRGALEGRFARGRGAVAMLGAELGSPTGAAVRAGMRMNDDASTVSLGAGYALGSIRLDYAFVPLRLDLGDTHRFSFSAQF